MINEYLLFPVPFPSLSDIQNKLKGPFSIYRTKRVQLHDAAYWSHGQRNALHLLTPLLSQGFVYKVMSGQKDFTKNKKNYDNDDEKTNLKTFQFVVCQVIACSSYARPTKLWQLHLLR